MEKENKKGYMVYSLKICINRDTDEIEYIAEGYDDDNVSFSGINPFDLDADITKFFTSEDMETIRLLYDIEEA
jgi:hypothetical protein